MSETCDVCGGDLLQFGEDDQLCENCTELDGEQATEFTTKTSDEYDFEV